MRNETMVVSESSLAAEALGDARRTVGAGGLMSVHLARKGTLMRAPKRQLAEAQDGFHSRDCPAKNHTIPQGSCA